LSIIIILAVIIWASLGTQPTQRVAGVKVGDVFTYELEGLWEPSDPNATLSDTILQLNMTEWYRVTITNVSDPEILIHTLWRFKNGTEIEGEGKVDIETGISSGGFYAIYAANLKAGEYTHPMGFDQVTINSTVTREYPGGTRETNRLILTAQFYNRSDPSQVYNDYRTMQFDKQTGMMVEFRNQNVYNNPKMTETIIWKLKDSNVWTVT
jgi:hypothetical protein